MRQHVAIRASVSDGRYGGAGTEGKDYPRRDIIRRGADATCLMGSQPALRDLEDDARPADPAEVRRAAADR